jgi:hypothetical protein
MIRGKPGLPSIRYLRSEESRERINKVFTQYGHEVFTMRDLKDTVLPDMTSGEIYKWSTSRVVEPVSRDSQTKITTWRLSEGVVNVMTYHANGGK